MLKNIYKYVLKKLHDFHLDMSDYYYGKMDEYGSENNDYYGVKVAKHTRKCLKIMEKLVAMEEF